MRVVRIVGCTDMKTKPKWWTPHTWIGQTVEILGGPLHIDVVVATVVIGYMVVVGTMFWRFVPYMLLIMFEMFSSLLLLLLAKRMHYEIVNPFVRLHKV